jgi:hypothetical protein
MSRKRFLVIPKPFYFLERKSHITFELCGFDIFQKKLVFIIAADRWNIRTTYGIYYG